MPTPRIVSASLIVIVMSAIAGGLGGPAHGQAPTDCGCADVIDLINRLNMDSVTIDVLNEEIPRIEAADKPSKSMKMYDRNRSGKTNYETLRDTIQQARDSNAIIGALSSRGETDGACHASVVKPSTACMDKIAMWHEEKVHVPACREDVKAGRTDVVGARKQSAMIDYATEEKAGYQSEIERIKDVLKTLPAECRPAGWVGLIHFVEEKKTSATTTVSKSGPYASTSTRQSDDVFTRTARILFGETDTPHGDVSVYSKTIERDSSTTRTTCDSSGRTTIPDRTVARGSEDVTEVSGTGQQDVSASFNFDPNTGKVQLSFEAPGAVATGTIQHSEYAHGECNPSANGSSTSPPAPLSTSYEKYLVALEGVGARNGDKVQGSKTIELTPAVNAPNVSLSHQGVVRWSFYEIK